MYCVQLNKIIMIGNKQVSYTTNQKRTYQFMYLPQSHTTVKPLKLATEVKDVNLPTREVIPGASEG